MVGEFLLRLEVGRVGIIDDSVCLNLARVRGTRRVGSYYYIEPTIYNSTAKWRKVSVRVVAAIQ